MSDSNTRRINVKNLLSDGRWHRTAEIESVQIGGSQGTRRLRELRASGMQIEKRRVPDSTQFEYRSVQQSPTLDPTSIDWIMQ